MNRIIKFRAWLKDKMYYQDSNTMSCMEGLEKFTQVVGNEKGYTPEVMQFTGLLDKNGKEIYEGDIVRWNGWNDGRESGYKVGQIIYHKKELGFRIKENHIDFSPSIYGYLEVIGNIFETPELLEK